MVRAPSRAADIAARLSLPTSTMCQLAGTLSAESVLYSAPWVTSLATMTSDREHQLDAALFRDRDDLAGVLDAIRLGQALADRLALGEEEGVGHPAADDEDVDLAREVVEDLDLVGDLGAADDRGEGALRLFHERRQELDLPLHEEADVGGQDRRHAVGRRVGAVRGAEGVVDVDVGVGGERLGEVGVVLLFFRVEAEVLEQEALARAGAAGPRPPSPGRARRPCTGR